MDGWDNRYGRAGILGECPIGPFGWYNEKRKK